MKVPLLDLQAQYAEIRAAIEPAVLAVFESQRFIHGPVVEECERRIAQYSGCRHGIGVSSGTDALLACLLCAEIGPGDEVITTPYTFFATVGCICRVGARPVFVDIDPDTYNMDVDQLEDRLTSRTKAVIPVHLFGQCARMDTVGAVAQRHNLVVIEDAAQAIGAEFQGQRAGSMGHYGCFSFFPSKNLGCAGDGGMIVTESDARAEKLRVLRNHGAKPKYYHSLVGGNFRLDAIQAAVVNVKLDYLDGWTQARCRNADRYREMFAGAGRHVTDRVRLPRTAVRDRQIFNQFVIRAERRDELARHLREHGIGTEVYYPVPIHLQECFSQLSHRAGDFPASEAAAKETLALPIYPELQAGQQQAVVSAIGEFYR